MKILDDIIRDLSDKDNQTKSKLVVRLKTSSWGTNNGLCIKKEISYLKRKSIGYNFIDEDIAMIGADEVFPRILNLNDCKDGIYEVITCNEFRDWESGNIEDYDYKLIPFTQTP